MSNEHIISSIICILAVDGKIEHQEIQFLYDICKRLQVSNPSDIEIFEHVKKGQGRVNIPSTPDEQIKLFTLLTQAAWSDGILTPEEQKALEAVAVKMGISVNGAQEILETYRPTKAEVKQLHGQFVIQEQKSEAYLHSQQESLETSVNQSKQDNKNALPSSSHQSDSKDQNKCVGRKWYDRGVVVFIVMGVFWPVGMYALWKSSLFSKGVKIFATIIIVIPILLSFGQDNIPYEYWLIDVGVVGLIALIVSRTGRPYKMLKLKKTNKEIEIFLEKMSPYLWEEINNIKKEFVATQQKIKHLYKLKARFPQQAKLTDESIAKFKKIHSDLHNVILETEENIEAAYVAYKIDEIKGRTKFAEIETEISNSIQNVLDSAQLIKSSLEEGVAD